MRRGVLGITCGIAKHTDSTMGLDGLLNELSCEASLSDAACNDVATGAMRLAGFLGFFERGEGPSVEGQCPASLGQSDGGMTSDACAGSSDDRVLFHDVISGALYASPHVHGSTLGDDGLRKGVQQALAFSLTSLNFGGRARSGRRVEAFEKSLPSFFVKFSQELIE